jgi:ACS family tartrate transporter-like MFS transporter
MLGRERLLFNAVFCLPMNPVDNAALYRRISLRIAPPLILLYFVAFLDRVNISFAALSMNRDLGISDEVFGLAAGIFFVGYLLFAVPSNVMLTRFGARRWIAVLMVTWGLLSGSMAFVHSVPAYIALRFCIGAAEAGFFPGVILYLTQWLPGSARAGIMALFTFSIPLSNVVGSPISAAILRLPWHGALAGWQWLFLLEALPAILLGCMVPWMLESSPSAVRWLSAAEKQALVHAMEQESSNSSLTQHGSSRPPLASLIAPSAIYFTMMIGLYALGFWVPRLLTSHGVVLAQLGWLTAVPFAFGAAGMFAWSRWSDYTRERRRNLAGALVTAGCGMLLTGFAPSASIAIVGLSLSAIGVFAAMPVFWAAFSQRIAVRHAAVGIAIVNSVGNIGGFLGPWTTGWLLHRTQSYAAGLAATAIVLLLGALLALLQSRPVQKELA